MRTGLTYAASSLLLGVLVMLPATGHAQTSGGAWLDAADIAPWNTAGHGVPAAPKVADPVNPRCREQARPPQTAEDRAVRARGWELVGPYQGGWRVVVVRGAASSDGMCRPLQYQDFVFVGGAFVGTLAPTPMDSRSDGALGRVTLQSATRLVAEYVRYAESDPLCCPTRTSSLTFELEGNPPVIRPLSATTTPNAQPSSASDSAGQRPSAAAPPSLAGTSWQLVKFEGGDDSVVTPDQRAKYTVAFAEGGQLTARVDCNRGRGSWKSDRPGHVEFGPMAMTLAMCPAGSLHDQIVKHWGQVRSYVVRDGHLFLALAADGGIYEFEPLLAQP